MAKVLGSLVGALVAKTGFAGVSDAFKDSNQRLIVKDTAALTTANVIGDTISLGFVKSSAFIGPNGSVFWNDALGAGVTLNIGDVTYPSGLAAAVAVSAAGGPTPLWKTFTSSKIGQPLWQALGYASDPKQPIELLAQIQGAAISTAGSVAWEIVGVNR